jgi:hypothetical protein
MFVLFSGKKFMSIHVEMADALDYQREFLEREDSSLASHIVEVNDLREFHREFWDTKKESV